MLVAEVDREERKARERAAQAAAWPPPLPNPGVGAATNRRRPCRVSFRLSAEEQRELERAGELLGLSPALAARMLVVRGVHQVLREAEAALG